MRPANRASNCGYCLHLQELRDVSAPVSRDVVGQRAHTGLRVHTPRNVRPARYRAPMNEDALFPATPVEVRAHPKLESIVLDCFRAGIEL